jgi:hypothetical protein
LGQEFGKKIKEKSCNLSFKNTTISIQRTRMTKSSLTNHIEDFDGFSRHEYLQMTHVDFEKKGPNKTLLP